MTRAVEEDRLERIERISLWLSQARTPSFYFESGYSQEDGEKAAADAAFVLAEIRKIMNAKVENDQEQ